jgi:phage gp29-like protein
LPPAIPAEREAEYQAQAEAIIGDARGTVPHGTQIHTVDSGARGKNPFEDHLRYQDELIVLAATGGKLTALSESGTGTLAASAHQQAFDDITEAEAALISETLQDQFDRPLLTQMFPGQPQLAYFELSATRALDPTEVINQALILAKAGYEIDPAELSQKTGYRLNLRNYALLPIPKPPAPETGTEPDPVEEEV